MSMEYDTYPLLLVPLWEEIQRRKKDDLTQEEAQHIANADAGALEPRVTPRRRQSDEHYQGPHGGTQGEICPPLLTAFQTANRLASKPASMSLCPLGDYGLLLGNPDLCASLDTPAKIDTDSGDSVANSLLVAMVAVAEALPDAKSPARATAGLKEFLSLVEDCRAYNDGQRGGRATAPQGLSKRGSLTKVMRTVMGDADPGRRTPAEILNSFARATTVQNKEEVSATLDCLGVGQTYVVCDGCDLHYGMEASFASIHAGWPCLPLVATTLPSRAEVRTVQDEVDARSVAFEQGLQGVEAEAYIVAPCPMCLPGGPSVRLARSPLAGSPPCMFIASTPAYGERGGSGRPPTPSHSVAAHGGTYRLVAVVHVDVSGDHDHYFCQALYLGCWQLFDDRQQENPRHLHEYTQGEFSTEAVFPSLMCYVREDHSKEDVILEMGRDDARSLCSAALDEMEKLVAKEGGGGSMGRWKVAHEASPAYHLPGNELSHTTMREVTTVLATSFCESGYTPYGTDAHEDMSDSSAHADTPDLQERRKLARGMASLWLDIIFFSFLPNNSEDTLELLQTRGFPKHLIKSACDSVPSLRWPHRGRLKWRQLCGGEWMGRVLGSFHEWTASAKAGVSV